MKKLGHVPALDGIRGVAIAAVVAYHFFDLPGGFFGVDLFFVLSGFLITTLLLEEQTRFGRVSLRGFYVRRARRLLPAAACVFIVTAIFAELASRAGDRQAGRVGAEGIAACVFYVANIFRMLGHRLPTELTPMWSLAQEEQFYLLWPALLIVACRRGIQPRRLAVVLGGMAVTVMMWRMALVLHGGANGRVYFGPDTRCDGLFAGSALAAARFAGMRLPRARWLGLVALAGFVMLTAFSHGSTVFAYAAGFPLVALAGVALIVAALGSGARLLEWRPVVWLGSISYGLYVWQATVVTHFGTGTAIVFAVLAGWASTRLIEQPFRRKRAERAPHVAAGADLSSRSPGRLRSRQARRPLRS